MGSELRMGKSEIQHFYEGKVVLLTGGTGFLGKLLIEKLLHSCPNIGHIYLLVREKHGVSADDRLARLLEDVAFSRLKKEQPRLREKLSVVVGDLHQPQLGLSAEQQSLLSHNVDVLIHSAATVRFDEPLGRAISTNVTGTKQLLLLAQQITNLKAFVYVSTAYSNCDQPLLQEKVVSGPLCPEKMISLAEILDGSTLDSLTPVLLGSKPNTYIFTKCGAEELVSRFKTSLPVAIIRPSMVLASLGEPLPGYMDSVQGPTGVVVSTSAGLMHTVLCNDSAVANIVPVDYVVNSIITLAYTVAKHQWSHNVGSESVPVINVVSPATNSILYREFARLLERHLVRCPSPRLIWYPFVTRPQQPWLAAVHRYLLHYLPANIIDIVLRLSGRPPKLRKLYDRMDKYYQTITYFCTKHFDFEDANFRAMWDMLGPSDQQLFPFNMAALDWDSYFSTYVLGCRQYLLREDPSTIPHARQKMKILYVIHQLSRGVLLLLLVRGLCSLPHLLGITLPADRISVFEFLPFF